MRRVLLGGAAALLLAGCGGGDDGGGDRDRDAARASVTAYFGALARGDAAGACARMSAPSREALAEYGADALRLRGAHSCAATVAALLRSASGPALRRTARAARVTSVGRTTDGDRPRYAVRVAGVNQDIVVGGPHGGTMAIISTPVGEPDKLPGRAAAGHETD